VYNEPFDGYRGSESIVKSQLFILAVLPALTLFGQTQSEPSRPQNPAPLNPASAPADGMNAAVDPHKYLIGPEDILYIKVWREPDFTLPVAVRPDGKITMPLIGEIQAAQQTPIQLTKTIIELLAKYVNNPDVMVSVTEVRSKKYYIDGQVNRPGSFPLVTPTTVLEALSYAGGFRDFANSKKIRILRGDKVYYFNYKEVTNGKRMEQNIKVENGDHIIVP
jgi:polysaccharide export outer membrane protein